MKFVMQQKIMAFFELKSSFKHYDLVSKSNLHMNILFSMLHPIFKTRILSFLPPFFKLFGLDNGFL
jgi:hypothetical protein